MKMFINISAMEIKPFNILKFINYVITRSELIIDCLKRADYFLLAYIDL